MTERQWSRRQVLATGSAAAASAAVGPALSGRARALSRSDEKPDHVTIEFDEDRLLKYRPRLQFATGEYEKFLNLYGWLATSPEHDTDVCVYWSEYSHQEGISDLDSHDGDHEPIYVFVQGGEPVIVAYSAYHWLAAKDYEPALDGTHPLMRVMPLHHQYTATTDIGRLTTIGDLTQAFDSWLENGLDESLAPGTVVNPWTMLSREHWWRRGAGGISWDALYVELLYALGLHNAGKSDL